MHCRWNTAETWKGDEVHGRALLCKRWQCLLCGPLRAAQLREQAMSGNPTTFITLTSRYIEGGDPAEAARRLVHAWRMTLQRGMREKRFDRLQYIAVFEETKQGWPHLHVLLRAPYVPQTWLSKAMADYSDSPIVDIRAVQRRERAAAYVAKYVSKCTMRWEGCKRYWCTQAWRQVERAWETGADGLRRSWAILEKFWWQRVEELQSIGVVVTMTSEYGYEGERCRPRAAADDVRDALA